MNALEMAYYIASSLYTNEFCAVCGCAIMIDAPKISVWADVRGSKVLRSAHPDCLSGQAIENTYKPDLSINEH